MVVACLRALETARPRTWRSVPVKGGTWSGWHVGYIPWPAIERWGFIRGLSVEVIDLLVEVVRRIDDDRADRQAAEFHAATSGG